MKRYICLAAMAAGVLFGATSCDGLFSDAPIDKLSGVNIWGDRLLLDEYENSWYRNMSNGFSIYMPTNGLVKSLGRDYPAWYTDQMTVSKTTWSSTSYGDILKSSDEEIYKRAYQYWNACYGQLRSINTLLDHAGEITTPTRDRVLGEAHFMRAYYYYLLLRRYGGVLLVDREYNTLNDPARFPRASYDEMVDFIVADPACCRGSTRAPTRAGPPRGPRSCSRPRPTCGPPRPCSRSATPHGWASRATAAARCWPRPRPPTTR